MGGARYSKAGSGITGCIMNKPGTSKGGQIVTISNTNIIQPQVYIHMHKLHKDSYWFYIVYYLTSLIDGESAGPEVKKKIKEKFCYWDNFSLALQL